MQAFGYQMMAKVFARSVSEVSNRATATARATSRLVERVMVIYMYLC